MTEYRKKKQTVCFALCSTFCNFAVDKNNSDMKRMVFILMMLTVVMTQASGKTCRVCGGLGHASGNSSIICSGCNGRGTVPDSPEEQRRAAQDRERYADNANDMMEQFNLSPDEYFAYEELIKQAMTQVPVYQDCTACNGTGDCRQCGGYMNVSLDDDLCWVCQGSGICPACRGAGRNLLGYQDNPNKDQLIQRAKEILNHGEQRPDRGENAYGTRNNPGYVPTGDDYDGGEYDDDDDGYEGLSGGRRGGSPIGYVLGGALAAGVLGGLGYLLFRKK